MRDIPFFITENGVASLTLKEIPYCFKAYIKIQNTQEPVSFLKECCDFCRMAGAQYIYASGHIDLTEYPFHTAIWKMCRLREGLSETDAVLTPVQQQTSEQWRNLYNKIMCTVPNATYMTSLDVESMLKKGNGYFVHRDKNLIGIGAALGETVDVLIAVEHGAGKDVLLALNGALSGKNINVEVASANTRAVALYERLGFVKIDEFSKWYQII